MLLLPLTAAACTGTGKVPAAEAPPISTAEASGETAGPVPAEAAGVLQTALDEYSAAAGAHLSAGVYELSSGRTWLYNPDGRYLEASLVKVPILLTLLRQATDDQRALTAEEEYLAAMMIEHSDNPSTTALYESVGGAEELARTYELLGVTQTEATEVWGAHDTGVEDQLRIARAVAEGVEWIDDDLMAVAVGLMENVEPGQRWGISASVDAAAAGTDAAVGTETDTDSGTAAGTGTEIALKNGWLQDDDLVWNVGSEGFVRSEAAGYAIVILTAGPGTMEDGVAVLEGAARLISSGGASPEAGPATGTGDGAGAVWREDAPEA